MTEAHTKIQKYQTWASHFPVWGDKMWITATGSYRYDLKNVSISGTTVNPVNSM